MTTCYACVVCGHIQKPLLTLDIEEDGWTKNLIECEACGTVSKVEYKTRTDD